MFTFINFAGSSGDTVSKLSAGTHHVDFKFIPTNLSDAFSVSEEHQFEIEPTGYYIDIHCSVSKQILF